jgi:hypothetical protein
MQRTVALWIRIAGKFTKPQYFDSKQTHLKPEDGQYHLRHAGKWTPVGSDPLLARRPVRPAETDSRHRTRHRAGGPEGHVHHPGCRDRRTHDHRQHSAPTIRMDSRP